MEIDHELLARATTVVTTIDAEGGAPGAAAAAAGNSIGLIRSAYLESATHGPTILLSPDGQRSVINRGGCSGFLGMRIAADDFATELPCHLFSLHDSSISAAARGLLLSDNAFDAGSPHSLNRVPAVDGAGGLSGERSQIAYDDTSLLEAYRSLASNIRSTSAAALREQSRVSFQDQLRRLKQQIASSLFASPSQPVRLGANDSRQQGSTPLLPPPLFAIRQPFRRVLWTPDSLFLVVITCEPVPVFHEDGDHDSSSRHLRHIATLGVGASSDAWDIETDAARAASSSRSDAAASRSSSSSAAQQLGRSPSRAVAALCAGQVAFVTTIQVFDAASTGRSVALFSSSLRGPANDAGAAAAAAAHATEDPSLQLSNANSTEGISLRRSSGSSWLRLGGVTEGCELLRLLSSLRQRRSSSGSGCTAAAPPARSISSSSVTTAASATTGSTSTTGRSVISQNDRSSTTTATGADSWLWLADAALLDCYHCRRSPSEPHRICSTYEVVLSLLGHDASLSVVRVSIPVDQSLQLQVEKTDLANSGSTPHPTFTPSDSSFSSSLHYVPVALDEQLRGAAQSCRAAASCLTPSSSSAVVAGAHVGSVPTAAPNASLTLVTRVDCRNEFTVVSSLTAPSVSCEHVDHSQSVAQSQSYVNSDNQQPLLQILNHSAMSDSEKERPMLIAAMAGAVLPPSVAAASSSAQRTSASLSAPADRESTSPLMQQTSTSDRALTSPLVPRVLLIGFSRLGSRPGDEPPTVFVLGSSTPGSDAFTGTGTFGSAPRVPGTGIHAATTTAVPYALPVLALTSEIRADDGRSSVVPTSTAASLDPSTTTLSSTSTSVDALSAAAAVLSDVIAAPIRVVSDSVTAAVQSGLTSTWVQSGSRRLLSSTCRRRLRSCGGRNRSADRGARGCCRREKRRRSHCAEHYLQAAPLLVYLEQPETATDSDESDSDDDNAAFPRTLSSSSSTSTTDGDEFQLQTRRRRRLLRHVSTLFPSLRDRAIGGWGDGYRNDRRLDGSDHDSLQTGIPVPEGMQLYSGMPVEMRFSPMMVSSALPTDAAAVPYQIERPRVDDGESSAATASTTTTISSSAATSSGYYLPRYLASRDSQGVVSVHALRSQRRSDGDNTPPMLLECVSRILPQQLYAVLTKTATLDSFVQSDDAGALSKHARSTSTQALTAASSTSTSFITAPHAHGSTSTFFTGVVWQSSDILALSDSSGSVWMLSFPSNNGSTIVTESSLSSSSGAPPQPHSAHHDHVLHLPPDSDSSALGASEECVTAEERHYVLGVAADGLRHRAAAVVESTASSGSNSSSSSLITQSTLTASGPRLMTQNLKLRPAGATDTAITTTTHATSQQARYSSLITRVVSPIFMYNPHVTGVGRIVLHWNAVIATRVPHVTDDTLANASRDHGQVQLARGGGKGSRQVQLTLAARGDGSPLLVLRSDWVKLKLPLPHQSVNISSSSSSVDHFFFVDGTDEPSGPPSLASTSTSDAGISSSASSTSTSDSATMASQASGSLDFEAALLADAWGALSATTAPAEAASSSLPRIKSQASTASTGHTLTRIVDALLKSLAANIYNLQQQQQQQQALELVAADPSPEASSHQLQLYSPSVTLLTLTGVEPTSLALSRLADPTPLGWVEAEPMLKSLLRHSSAAGAAAAAAASLHQKQQQQQHSDALQYHTASAPVSAAAISNGSIIDAVCRRVWYDETKEFALIVPESASSASAAAPSSSPLRTAINQQVSTATTLPSIYWFRAVTLEQSLLRMSASIPSLCFCLAVSVGNGPVCVELMRISVPPHTGVVNFNFDQYGVWLPVNAAAELAMIALGLNCAGALALMLPPPLESVLSPPLERSAGADDSSHIAAATAAATAAASAAGREPSSSDVASLSLLVSLARAILLKRYERLGVYAGILAAAACASSSSPAILRAEALESSYQPQPPSSSSVASSSSSSSVAMSPALGGESSAAAVAHAASTSIDATERAFPIFGLEWLWFRDAPEVEVALVFARGPLALAEALSRRAADVVRAAITTGSRKGAGTTTSTRGGDDVDGGSGSIYASMPTVSMMLSSVLRQYTPLLLLRSCSNGNDDDISEVRAVAAAAEYSECLEQQQQQQLRLHPLSLPLELLFSAWGLQLLPHRLAILSAVHPSLGPEAVGFLLPRVRQLQSRDDQRSAAAHIAEPPLDKLKLAGLAEPPGDKLKMASGWLVFPARLRDAVRGSESSLRVANFNLRSSIASALHCVASFPDANFNLYPVPPRQWSQAGTECYCIIPRTLLEFFTTSDSIQAAFESAQVQAWTAGVEDAPFSAFEGGEGVAVMPPAATTTTVAASAEGEVTDQGNAVPLLPTTLAPSSSMLLSSGTSTLTQPPPTSVVPVQLLPKLSLKLKMSSQMAASTGFKLKMGSQVAPTGLKLKLGPAAAVGQPQLQLVTSGSAAPPRPSLMPRLVSSGNAAIVEPAAATVVEAGTESINLITTAAAATAPAPTSATSAVPTPAATSALSDHDRQLRQQFSPLFYHDTKAGATAAASSSSASAPTLNFNLDQQNHFSFLHHFNLRLIAGAVVSTASTRLYSGTPPLRTGIDDFSASSSSPSGPSTSLPSGAQRDGPVSASASSWAPLDARSIAPASTWVALKGDDSTSTFVRSLAQLLESESLGALGVRFYGLDSDIATMGRLLWLSERCEASSSSPTKLMLLLCDPTTMFSSIRDCTVLRGVTSTSADTLATASITTSLQCDALLQSGASTSTSFRIPLNVARTLSSHAVLTEWYAARAVRAAVDAGLPGVGARWAAEGCASTSIWVAEGCATPSPLAALKDDLEVLEWLVCGGCELPITATPAAVEVEVDAAASRREEAAPAPLLRSSEVNDATPRGAELFSAVENDVIAMWLLGSRKSPSTAGQGSSRDDTPPRALNATASTSFHHLRMKMLLADATPETIQDILRFRILPLDDFVAKQRRGRPQLQLRLHCREGQLQFRANSWLHATLEHIVGGIATASFGPASLLSQVEVATPTCFSRHADSLRYFSLALGIVRSSSAALPPSTRCIRDEITLLSFVLAAVYAGGAFVTHCAAHLHCANAMLECLPTGKAMLARAAAAAAGATDGAAAIDTPPYSAGGGKSTAAFSSASGSTATRFSDAPTSTSFCAAAPAAVSVVKCLIDALDVLELHLDACRVLVRISSAAPTQLQLLHTRVEVDPAQLQLHRCVLDGLRRIAAITGFDCLLRGDSSNSGLIAPARVFNTRALRGVTAIPLPALICLSVDASDCAAVHPDAAGSATTTVDSITSSSASSIFVNGSSAINSSGSSASICPFFLLPLCTWIGERVMHTRVGASVTGALHCEQSQVEGRAEQQRDDADSCSCPSSTWNGAGPSSPCLLWDAEAASEGGIDLVSVRENSTSSGDDSSTSSDFGGANAMRLQLRVAVDADALISDLRDAADCVALMHQSATSTSLHHHATSSSSHRTMLLDVMLGSALSQLLADVTAAPAVRVLRPTADALTSAQELQLRQQGAHDPKSGFAMLKLPVKSFDRRSQHSRGTYAATRTHSADGRALKTLKFNESSSSSNSSSPPFGCVQVQLVCAPDAALEAARALVTTFLSAVEVVGTAEGGGGGSGSSDDGEVAPAAAAAAVCAPLISAAVADESEASTQPVHHLAIKESTPIDAEVGSSSTTSSDTTDNNDDAVISSIQLQGEEDTTTSTRVATTIEQSTTSSDAAGAVSAQSGATATAALPSISTLHTVAVPSPTSILLTASASTKSGRWLRRPTAAAAVLARAQALMDCEDEVEREGEGGGNTSATTTRFVVSTIETTHRGTMALNASAASKLLRVVLPFSTPAILSELKFIEACELIAILASLPPPALKLKLNPVISAAASTAAALSPRAVRRALIAGDGARVVSSLLAAVPHAYLNETGGDTWGGGHDSNFNLGALSSSLLMRIPQRFSPWENFSFSGRSSSSSSSGSTDLASGHTNFNLDTHVGASPSRVETEQSVANEYSALISRPPPRLLHCDDLEFASRRYRQLQLGTSTTAADVIEKRPVSTSTLTRPPTDAATALSSLLVHLNEIVEATSNSASAEAEEAEESSLMGDTPSDNLDELARSLRRHGSSSVGPSASSSSSSSSHASAAAAAASAAAVSASHARAAVAEARSAALRDVRDAVNAAVRSSRPVVSSVTPALVARSVKALTAGGPLGSSALFSAALGALHSVVTAAAGGGSGSSSGGGDSANVVSSGADYDDNAVSGGTAAATASSAEHPNNAEPSLSVTEVEVGGWGDWPIDDSLGPNMGSSAAATTTTDATGSSTTIEPIADPVSAAAAAATHQIEVDRLEGMGLAQLQLLLRSVNAYESVSYVHRAQQPTEVEVERHADDGSLHRRIDDADEEDDDESAAAGSMKSDRIDLWRHLGPVVGGAQLQHATPADTQLQPASAGQKRRQLQLALPPSCQSAHALRPLGVRVHRLCRLLGVSSKDELGRVSVSMARAALAVRDYASACQLAGQLVEGMMNEPMPPAAAVPPQLQQQHGNTNDATPSNAASVSTEPSTDGPSSYSSSGSTAAVAGGRSAALRRTTLTLAADIALDDACPALDARAFFAAFALSTEVEVDAPSTPMRAELQFDASTAALGDESSRVNVEVGDEIPLSRCVEVIQTLAAIADLSVILPPRTLHEQSATSGVRELHLEPNQLLMRLGEALLVSTSTSVLLRSAISQLGLSPTSTSNVVPAPVFERRQKQQQQRITLASLTLGRLAADAGHTPLNDSNTSNARYDSDVEHNTEAQQHVLAVAAAADAALDRSVVRCIHSDSPSHSPDFILAWTALRSLRTIGTTSSISSGDRGSSENSCSNERESCSSSTLSTSYPSVGLVAHALKELMKSAAAEAETTSTTISSVASTSCVAAEAASTHRRVLSRVLCELGIRLIAAAALDSAMPFTSTASSSTTSSSLSSSDSSAAVSPYEGMLRSPLGVVLAALQQQQQLDSVIQVEAGHPSSSGMPQRREQQQQLLLLHIAPLTDPSLRRFLSFFVTCEREAAFKDNYTRAIIRLRLCAGKLKLTGSGNDRTRLFSTLQTLLSAADSTAVAAATSPTSATPLSSTSSAPSAAQQVEVVSTSTRPILALAMAAGMVSALPTVLYHDMRESPTAAADAASAAAAAASATLNNGGSAAQLISSQQGQQQQQQQTSSKEEVDECAAAAAYALDVLWVHCAAVDNTDAMRNHTHTADAYSSTPHSCSGTHSSDAQHHRSPLPLLSLMSAAFMTGGFFAAVETGPQGCESDVEGASSVPLQFQRLRVSLRDTLSRSSAAAAGEAAGAALDHGADDFTTRATDAIFSHIIIRKLAPLLCSKLKLAQSIEPSSPVYCAWANYALLSLLQCTLSNFNFRAPEQTTAVPAIFNLRDVPSGVAILSQYTDLLSALLQAYPSSSRSSSADAHPNPGDGDANNFNVVIDALAVVGAPPHSVKVLPSILAQDGYVVYIEDAAGVISALLSPHDVDQTSTSVGDRTSTYTSVGLSALVSALTSESSADVEFAVPPLRCVIPALLKPITAPGTNFNLGVIDTLHRVCTDVIPGLSNLRRSEYSFNYVSDVHNQPQQQQLQLQRRLTDVHASETPSAWLPTSTSTSAPGIDVTPGMLIECYIDGALRQLASSSPSSSMESLLGVTRLFSELSIDALWRLHSSLSVFAAALFTPLRESRQPLRESGQRRNTVAGRSSLVPRLSIPLEAEDRLHAVSALHAVVLSRLEEASSSSSSSSSSPQNRSISALLTVLSLELSTLECLAFIDEDARSQNFNVTRRADVYRTATAPFSSTILDRIRIALCAQIDHADAQIGPNPSELVALLMPPPPPCASFEGVTSASPACPSVVVSSGSGAATAVLHSPLFRLLASAGLTRVTNSLIREILLTAGGGTGETSPTAAAAAAVGTSTWDRSSALVRTVVTSTAAQASAAVEGANASAAAVPGKTSTLCAPGSAKSLVLLVGHLYRISLRAKAVTTVYAALTSPPTASTSTSSTAPKRGVAAVEADSPLALLARTAIIVTMRLTLTDAVRAAAVPASTATGAAPYASTAGNAVAAPAPAGGRRQRGGPDTLSPIRRAIDTCINLALYLQRQQQRLLPREGDVNSESLSSSDTTSTSNDAVAPALGELLVLLRKISRSPAALVAPALASVSSTSASSFSGPSPGSDGGGGGRGLGREQLLDSAEECASFLGRELAGRLLSAGLADEEDAAAAEIAVIKSIVTSVVVVAAAGGVENRAQVEVTSWPWGRLRAVVEPPSASTSTLSDEATGEPRSSHAPSSSSPSLLPGISDVNSVTGRQRYWRRLLNCRAQPAADERNFNFETRNGQVAPTSNLNFDDAPGSGPALVRRYVSLAQLLLVWSSGTHVNIPVPSSSSVTAGVDADASAPSTPISASTSAVVGGHSGYETAPSQGEEGDRSFFPSLSLDDSRRAAADALVALDAQLQLGSSDRYSDIVVHTNAVFRMQPLPLPTSSPSSTTTSPLLDYPKLWTELASALVANVLRKVEAMTNAMPTSSSSLQTQTESAAASPAVAPASAAGANYQDAVLLTRTLCRLLLGSSVTAATLMSPLDFCPGEEQTQFGRFPSTHQQQQPISTSVATLLSAHRQEQEQGDERVAFSGLPSRAFDDLYRCLWAAIQPDTVLSSSSSSGAGIGMLSSSTGQVGSSSETATVMFSELLGLSTRLLAQLDDSKAAIAAAAAAAAATATAAAVTTETDVSDDADAAPLISTYWRAPTGRSSTIVTPRRSRTAAAEASRGGSPKYTVPAQRGIACLARDAAFAALLFAVRSRDAVHVREGWRAVAAAAAAVASSSSQPSSSSSTLLLHRSSASTAAASAGSAGVPYLTPQQFMPAEVATALLVACSSGAISAIQSSAAWHQSPTGIASDALSFVISTTTTLPLWKSAIVLGVAPSRPLQASHPFIVLSLAAVTSTPAGWRAAAAWALADTAMRLPTPPIDTTSGGGSGTASSSDAVLHSAKTVRSYATSLLLHMLPTLHAEAGVGRSTSSADAARGDHSDELPWGWSFVEPLVMRALRRCDAVLSSEGEATAGIEPEEERNGAFSDRSRPSSSSVRDREASSAAYYHQQQQQQRLPRLPVDILPSAQPASLASNDDSHTEEEEEDEEVADPTALGLAAAGSLFSFARSALDAAASAAASAVAAAASSDVEDDDTPSNVAVPVNAPSHRPTSTLESSPSTAIPQNNDEIAVLPPDQSRTSTLSSSRGPAPVTSSSTSSSSPGPAPVISTSTSTSTSYRTATPVIDAPLPASSASLFRDTSRSNTVKLPPIESFSSAALSQPTSLFTSSAWGAAFASAPSSSSSSSSAAAASSSSFGGMFSRALGSVAGAVAEAAQSAAAAAASAASQVDLGAPSGGSGEEEEDIEAVLFREHAARTHVTANVGGGSGVGAPSTSSGTGTGALRGWGVNNTRAATTHAYGANATSAAPAAPPPHEESIVEEAPAEFVTEEARDVRTLPGDASDFRGIGSARGGTETRSTGDGWGDW